MKWIQHYQKKGDIQQLSRAGHYLATRMRNLRIPHGNKERKMWSFPTCLWTYLCADMPMKSCNSPPKALTLAFNYTWLLTALLSQIQFLMPKISPLQLSIINFKYCKPFFYLLLFYYEQTSFRTAWSGRELEHRSKRYDVPNTGKCLRFGV